MDDLIFYVLSAIAIVMVLFITIQLLNMNKYNAESKRRKLNVQINLMEQFYDIDIHSSIDNVK